MKKDYEKEQNSITHLLRHLLLAVVFMVCLFVSDKVFAEANVHALVINGRPLNLAASTKMYETLKKNKLPYYSTSASNIQMFTYEVSSSKKHTTNEDFYAALDNAFSGSKKSDLNILFFSGHGSANGIPTWMKGDDPVTGILYEDLVPYLNRFKGKFIYISNACFARAFYTCGVSPLKLDNKFLCLSATSQGDVSIANLYTNRIMKGIGYDTYEKGPADYNKDGLYTGSELKTYTNLESLLGSTYIDGVGPGNATPIFQMTYLEMGKKKIKLNLEKEETGTLTVTMKQHVDGVKRDVIWKSSNEKVVTVSSEKTTSAEDHKITLTPHKAGKATITAYLSNNNTKCCGTEVECTVEVTNYKSLYKAFLKKGSCKMKSGNYSYNLPLTSFQILDINQDKTPELIVKSSEPSYGLAMDEHYVFTIRKGKVAYCGSYAKKGEASVQYSKKYKAVRNSGWTNFVGGSWFHLFQLKNNKKIVQYKYVWEGFADEENTKYVYYIGDSDTKAKKVSKAKYNAFFKKYFNKNLFKTYKFRKNTAKNRNKIFGK